MLVPRWIRERSDTDMTTLEKRIAIQEAILSDQHAKMQALETNPVTGLTEPYNAWIIEMRIDAAEQRLASLRVRQTEDKD